MKKLADLTPEERRRERVRRAVAATTQSGSELAEAEFLTALRDADREAGRLKAVEDFKRAYLQNLGAEPPPESTDPESSSDPS